MATYAVANELSLDEAAYIAGLVDGEGTVALSRKHKSDNRQLAISISSTERQLLTFVKDRTGVGKITNKRAYNPAHTPSFTYAVYNRQALDVLRQIHPYLLTYKARRSAPILKHYVELTPRNGKYTTVLRSERTCFEEAVMSIKPSG